MELYKFVLSWIIMVVMGLILYRKGPKSSDIIVTSLNREVPYAIILSPALGVFLYSFGIIYIQKMNLPITAPIIISAIVVFLLLYAAFTVLASKVVVAKTGIYAGTNKFKWNQIESCKIVDKEEDNNICEFVIKVNFSKFKQKMFHIEGIELKLEVEPEDKDMVIEAFKREIA